MKTVYSRIMTPVLFTVIALLMTGPALMRQGFLFLLDMVWGPHFDLARSFASGIPAQAPFTVIFAGLSSFIPAFIIQKCLITAVLVSIGGAYFSLIRRFTGKAWALVAASWAMINPWVFERLIAGQWLVLAGYAYAPLVMLMAFKIQTRTEGSRRSKYLFLISYAIYPVISLHGWYLMTGFLAVYAATIAFQRYRAGMFTRASLAHGITALLAGLLIFALVNAFWLVGFFAPSSTYRTISQSDISAFTLQSDPSHGPFLTAATLYGFWSRANILPKDIDPLWPAAAWWTGIFVLIGAAAAWRTKEPLLRALILSGAAALLLSSAPASASLKPIIENLARFIPGFAGLRDGQKMLMLLAAAYAVFIPIGMSWITQKFSALRVAPFGKAIVSSALTIALLAPGVATIRAARAQLVPHPYPTDWYDAQAILLADPERQKTLVLPWHGYLALSFTDDRIVSNPAARFFDAPLIAPQTVENDFLIQQDRTDWWDQKIYQLIQGFDTFGNSKDELHNRGISHIVLLKEQDWQRYEELLANAPMIEKIFDSDPIALYRLRE